ncbi:MULTISPECIES: NlpC/P60 family protein [Mycobacteriaceae]|uniref:Glycoside hydrolase n=1 Tax=Mycolicibacterium neoaurum VKM Ac-1815D TaxID=700508 RepID=V5XAU9_MYCNE|nr:MULTISPECIES: NlpC/P60 family protein [Mycobacteriaceae]AHC24529.1 glycoside hydrolase [Mycolicibacterium neoaurum VKM Ac-1815D]AMO05109.1 glycoside hydrolase [Mycolicibacterium neoaurum]AXK76582.1 glycoside hydrolase [Mycolicibacterium neoaurum]KJQ52199.1 glycoside hydrolase [Mycolicibacterium neoaurum]KUM07831.1 glycoside hydrolase [Mycolicibacterium neoaurum]
MPTALSTPLHHLLAQLGPGAPARPDAELAVLGSRLSETAAALGRLADALPQSWSGPAASAASGYLREVSDALHALAEHLGALGAEIDEAAGTVTGVRAELERLITDFETRAAALQAQPGGAEVVADEAQRAHAAANGLVGDLRGRLAGGAQNLATPPPALAPAGLGPVATGSAGGARPGSGLADAVLAAHRQIEAPDAAQFGAGEAVRLPDGSTVAAPNAVAAGAVRHALTQLGVPYQWGGTTAGVGLDCSGLTQWAYREAGLDIPRLAQEQDIGAAVDAGSLRPGDLAVWDGHVAMIVGNNTMIEAGDPVQLSPVRTTNAGQGFQGFWRPTA